MVCLYRERKLCDLRAVVKILKPKRSDSRIWKPLKLHSFKCRGSLKDLGEEWICDTHTYRYKGQDTFEYPLAQFNLYYFQRFSKHLECVYTPPSWVFYLLHFESKQITIQIPTVHARARFVNGSARHSVTITQTTMTANDKSITFSPKSTKEDCPTVLNDESAGMTSTLVKFPSCENDH